MTSSTGCSGFTRFGSPPSRTMPSRIAARSTTAGTPVKSCSSTRAGMKEISRGRLRLTSHAASASMSSPVDEAAVLVAQQVFEQNFQRIRQPGQPGHSGSLERRQAEVLEALPADGQGGPVSGTNSARASSDHPLLGRSRSSRARKARATAAGSCRSASTAWFMARMSPTRTLPASEAIASRTAGCLQDRRAARQRHRVVGRKVMPVVVQHDEIVGGDQPAGRVARDQVDLMLRQARDR